MCTHIYNIYNVNIYIYRATVERHYIKHGHTLQSYRSSSFPIASHSPGTLFLNASIRLRKIARTSHKYQILTIKILCSSKTFFRALAVAFALSKDEWLRLFTPCCLLFPRNLRLDERAAHRLESCKKVLFDAVSWYFTARLARTEKGMKSKSMEEENRRKDGGFPNP